MESEEKVVDTMRDLRAAQVDFLIIGQYFGSSPKHALVEKYIWPEQFASYEQLAIKEGFLYWALDPFVRSGYSAAEFFVKAALQRRHD